MISEQQSQKRGVRSEAQEEYEAREDPYDPKPSSSAVGGAFGSQKKTERSRAGANSEAKARE